MIGSSRFSGRGARVRGGRGARVRGALAALSVAALLAGCASADKTTTSSDSKTHAGSMVGMNMGSTVATGATVSPTIKGIKAVPTQVLASTTWQGMDISADAMTAVPFVIFDGTKAREVKPSEKTTFHLMVMLTDAQTHVAIPYASVWATIRRGSTLVYDERLWPMISRYMGPHYGNDVSLPGPGEYKLSLLVSPPESARHMEYAHVWLKPHRASFTFHWKAPS